MVTIGFFNRGAELFVRTTFYGAAGLFTMHQNNSIEIAAQNAADVDLLTHGLPYDEQRYPVPYSPDERFPQLWGCVALRRAELGFADGKPFVDCEPVDSIEAVEGRLAVASVISDDDKIAFWRTNFKAPGYVSDIKGAVAESTDVPLSEHITDMWPRLTYHVPQDSGTLLGTRHPHLKSGERYSEGYYWDISDGIEGMITEAQESPAMWRQVFGVLRNLADTIERFGFIPNGMRSYYLSRSQPPKYAQMVRRVAESYNGGSRHSEIIEEFLPQIVKEYEWWMKGAEHVDARAGVRAADHVVVMPDGEMMNRYWDTKDTPRPESAEEDWHTAQRLPESQRGNFYRNVRILAECGRDMNGEMLEDPERLETAIAERIVPVDLNSILADTERMIAEAHVRAGRSVPAQQFQAAFEARKAAILKYNVGYNGYPSAFKFRDNTFTEGAPTGYKSMNMAHPAARGLLPPEIAENVCRILVDEFLQQGGFVASLYRTGHQWDWPNGWAPDQEEGQNALTKTAELTGNNLWNLWADVAKLRWVNHNSIVYRLLGKVSEKTNVVTGDPLDVQNGEYNLQFDFLWTIGILRKFMSKMVQCPTIFGMKAAHNEVRLIVPSIN